MASGATVPTIHFEFDYERTKAALLYLTSRHLPKFDKYQAFKLLFLADRAHLLRFGRTITGDSYDAWTYGPCPTETKRILDSLQRLEEGEPTTCTEAVDIAKILDLTQDKYPCYRLKAEANLEALSESDRLILDQVANQYGSKGSDDLYNLTHDLAAYKSAWQGGSESDRYRMRFEDFFIEAPDREPILRELREEQQLRRLFLASLSV